MGFAGRPVQEIGEARVEVDLDQDRHRQQRDDQRLLDDLFALETEQQHEGRQQGHQRGRLQAREQPLQARLPAARQDADPQELRQGDRHDDVEADREQKRLPRHGDGRQAEQQAHDRRECKHHDRVVEGDLGQREVGFAVGQVAPDEHHGRAGCRREQDEAGDIAVDLVGRQPRREQVADEQPAQRGHRERLYRPVDEQCHADAAPVLADLADGGEIDLDQHRDDHQPDQDGDRQVDVGDLGRTDGVEDGGKEMA